MLIWLIVIIIIQFMMGKGGQISFFGSFLKEVKSKVIWTTPHGLSTSFVFSAHLRKRQWKRFLQTQRAGKHQGNCDMRKLFFSKRQLQRYFIFQRNLCPFQLWDSPSREGHTDFASQPRPWHIIRRIIHNNVKLQQYRFAATSSKTWSKTSQRRIAASNPRRIVGWRLSLSQGS